MTSHRFAWLLMLPMLKSAGGSTSTVAANQVASLVEEEAARCVKVLMLPVGWLEVALEAFLGNVANVVKNEIKCHPVPASITSTHERPLSS